jgi:hypothetical protein
LNSTPISSLVWNDPQLVDLLRERTRGRVRKWSFDVQGPDADVVANLSSTLDALARTKETLAVTGEREGGEEEEEGAEKEKRGREIDGAWTVVFVEVRSIHWFPYDPVGVVNADP